MSNESTEQSGFFETWSLEEECKKCHRRRIDRSENKNSVLCHDCREEQIRYPFPKKMIPVVMLAFAILAFSMVRTPKVLENYRIFIQAKEKNANGEIYKTIIDLHVVLDEYPDSIPIAKQLVDLAMKSGYYDYAAYIMNEYIAGKTIDDSTYYSLMSYSDKLDRYYNTFDELEDIYGELEFEDDPEEQLKEMEYMLLELLDDEECYPALVYYYLGSIASNQKQAIKYLEASIKEDPLLMYPEILLGTLYRRSGDLKRARERYESVLARDQSEPSALRAMGILLMLEEEKEDGLELVRKAYEINPDTEYVRETLVIALLETNRNEEAEILMTQFDEMGIEFEEEFANYQNGAVRLYDYYVTPEIG